MDLRMPEMEGAQAIVELRRMQPDIRILVLTNYEADEDIFRALQAGAMGYLIKSTPQEEIVKAVEMVHENKRCQAVAEMAYKTYPSIRTLLLLANALQLQVATRMSIVCSAISGLRTLTRRSSLLHWLKVNPTHRFIPLHEKISSVLLRWTRNRIRRIICLATSWPGSTMWTGRLANIAPQLN